MRAALSVSSVKEVGWDLWWQDHGISPDFLSQMQGHQRVNHFLGTYHMARKNTLAINLNKFRKVCPDEFDFFPHTWLYPIEFY